MTEITGKYKFNTRVCNVPEAVFLYKKLQNTTRPFEYQSDSKSWQLHEAPVKLSSTGRRQLVALELPDNTGDYESEAKAKEQKRKAEKKDVPCISNDRGDTEPGADSRQIIVLWVIRDASFVEPEFVIAGNCAGYQGATITNPLGITDADYIADGAYSILKSPFIFANSPNDFESEYAVGYKPWLDVGDAVFCQSKPFGVQGRVSYRLNVSWKNSAYIPSRDSTSYYDMDGVAYGSAPSPAVGSNPPSAEEVEDLLEVVADDTRVVEISTVYQMASAFIEDLQTMNSCGSDALDGWWGYNLSIAASQLLLLTYDDPPTIDQRHGYICWQGSQSAYGAWEAYMNQMLTFWGVLSNGAVLTRVGSMAINSQGGSCSQSPTGDPAAGYPPDPNPTALPLIGRGQYHGRYCDIFVNYQKNGIVKELKLPIDFPTRITHVVYEHTGFYDPNLPMESPGQRTEEPPFFSLAEWFSGRVNIDKENIYVDIIYEIVREYETGKKIIPNGVLNGATYRTDWAPERPGTISRYVTPYGGGDFSDGSISACLLANSDANGQVYARPIRDKFNKTIRYTISKASFTITNTETFNDTHSDEKDLFTDNFLKHNTILNISQRHDYPYYNSLNAFPPDYSGIPGSPAVIPPSPNLVGYLGLPTPYFQIATNPDNNYVSNLFTAIERFYSYHYTDYTANTANDFLTLKTDWNNIYWLFYLMMEKPYINRADINKLIDFYDRGNQGGAGYNKNNNKIYLQYQSEIPGLNGNYDNRHERVAPGFFELYIEHERLRGYPTIKDGKIKQWLRLRPKSFPLFQQTEPYI